MTLSTHSFDSPLLYCGPDLLNEDLAVESELNVSSSHFLSISGKSHSFLEGKEVSG